MGPARDLREVLRHQGEDARARGKVERVLEVHLKHNEVVLRAALLVIALVPYTLSAGARAGRQRGDARTPGAHVHLVPHSVDHALRAARTRHPKLPAGGLVAPEEHSRLVLDDGAETFGGDAAHDLPGRDGPHVKHAAIGLVQSSELGSREVQGHKGWHTPVHQHLHHTGQVPQQRRAV